MSHDTYSYLMIQSFRVLCIITVVTPSGVKHNIKKEFVTCFVIGGKPSKGKTKGILLGKLIFPPSTSVWRLEAFTLKNCSFQLLYLFTI